VTRVLRGTSREKYHRHKEARTEDYSKVAHD